jgi:excisionase family DNA binding protein
MQQPAKGPPRPEPIKPVTITVETYTQMFGLGRTTVFRLLSEGKLERVRIGRRTLITMASAEALIESSARNVEARR